MKVTYLYLKNFVHIFSGLGKYEVELDFTKSNKVINVLIGKMGSCKTVILGSMQPFSSFGTLDVRNQDDLIIEGEDGLKIIDYQDGNTSYHIEHIYTWNKTTHNVKSYIQRNQVELNPNGNQSSFKMIIENEFGIEQNFMRLLRLGSNVSNVINMKSTERKTFIASLLKDAEIYTMLYKKLSDDMRNMNSQVSVLTNKLNHIGLNNESNIKSEYKHNESKISELNLKYDGIKAKIYSIKGSINAILKDRPIEDYYKEYDFIKSQVSDLTAELNKINEYIEKVECEYPSINEVSKHIGALDLSIAQLNELIMNLENDYSEKTTSLSKLVDNKKIKSSEDQLYQLHNTYDSLVQKAKDYESQLSGFKVEYSAPQITKLLADLSIADSLVSDIIVYDSDTIKKVYSSDHSINTWAKKQIDFLNFKKIKLQKDINNIKYSENYQSTCTMFTPPFCPTESCPYLKTHPYTIRKKTEDSILNNNPELEAIMNEVDALDLKIAKFESYPIVFAKMGALKAIWKQCFHMLDSLHALNTNSLITILINGNYQNNWYDSHKLEYVIELCEKRNAYYQLLENLNNTKSEIQSIEILKDSSIDEQINTLESDIDSITNDLAIAETKLKQNTEELKGYNKIYLELSELSNKKSSRDQIATQISEQKKVLQEFNSNKETIDIAKQDLVNLQSLELEISSKLKTLITTNESIKVTLNDLSYTKEEYDKVMIDKENLKYIIDAVSSKEGIPLVLVKMFLNNCRDIVNELISDVFGDMIEVLEFNITESDFKIPYTLNGVMVEDIEKASQGQQAVISIALSFALVRQSMFKYNIMLLDEIDGPLYKHDRSKFVTILMKQLQAINGEQVFLISHNTEIFNQMNVNYICTTQELVDSNESNSIMYV